MGVVGGLFGTKGAGETREPGQRLPDPLSVQQTKILTPDTAVERILSSLEPYYPAKITPERLDGMLDSLGVPRKYTDSQGRTRGYSFPKSFNLIMIEEPTYYITSNDTRVFSFCLGMRRTEHDPQSGRVNGHWSHYTGPTVFHHSLKTPEENDLTKYPLVSPVYQGNEPTCWARSHIIFPPNHKPFMGLSALQNEHIEVNAQVRQEFIGLFENSRGRWRNYYKKKLQEIDGVLSEGEPHYDKLFDELGKPVRKRAEEGQFFAYPNRSLLLPLLGLQVARDLGVGVYAVERGNSPVYQQAIYLLRSCETKIKIVAVEGLDVQHVDEELAIQYGR